MDNDATLGLYFIHCSAINSALLPADNASTTKLSGQASTISSVCVPMLPVEPRMEMRFWKVEPLRHSARVFCRDSGELTGAEGSIHPAPVPAEPGDENVFREVVRR